MLRFFKRGGDMALEKIGKYEVDISAVQLSDADQWIPYLEIFTTPSRAEKVRNVFPRQRVSSASVFNAASEAKLEARRVALSMIGWGRF
jgi:hypothetical protein